MTAACCGADDQSAIRADPAEVAEWQFRSPDVFADLMPDRLSRQLPTALTARGNGRTIYAEHGAAASL